jgi:hypothetical protein
MSSPTTSNNKLLWTGRVLSTLPVLFLVMDIAFKFISPPPQPVIDACKELGWPLELNTAVGIILALCLIAHLIPRTAVLGAVLLTGYLGGAVAIHVRVHNPLLSHTLFPFYIAIPLWLGLLFRDPRLRAIFPLRR